MNQQDQTTQTKPISDDQELAKVLAGVPKDSNDLSFDDSSAPIPTAQPEPQVQNMPDPITPPAPAPAQSDIGVVDNSDFKLPEMPPVPSLQPEPQGQNMPDPITPPAPIMPDFAKNLLNNQLSNTTSGQNSQDLESIRKDALLELKPLVEKLDLAPEEKFDIYLLLLRSTDDTTLIAPAHEAAKNITDETKRAEALLDIIKEIDFLSRPADNNQQVI